MNGHNSPTNFDYSELTARSDDKHTNAYLQIQRTQFALLAKAWSSEANSEWMLRNFLAVKMLLGANVLLGSRQYCVDRNVRIVDRYLAYYALLSCARALVFTCPHTRYNDGELITMTHSKIGNIASDIMSHLSQNLGREVRDVLHRLQSARELFSYRFPASGLESVPANIRVNMESVIETCRLFGMAAQINSEILEKDIKKHASPVDPPESLPEEAFTYPFSTLKDQGLLLDDEEDWYRIGYAFRKIKTPCGLDCMATEGFVEEFYFSWYPEDEESDQFNPRDSWDIVFPFG